MFDALRLVLAYSATGKFAIISAVVDKNLKKLQSVHLHQSTPLQIMVWRVRRIVRDVTRRDLLDTLPSPSSNRAKLRRLYLKFDASLLKHIPTLARNTPRDVALKRIRDVLKLELGYDFYEVDEKRPWGGFFRIVDGQTDKFLKDFFPGLSKEEARQGRKDTELSPKIMVWLPGKRISWQYHHRRAERWHFLTGGLYWRSLEDELPAAIKAEPGEIVQFAQGERHRGGAPETSYALVAEIWQHTNPKRASNEADVVRLADDYDRPKRPTLS